MNWKKIIPIGISVQKPKRFNKTAVFLQKWQYFFVICRICQDSENLVYSNIMTYEFNERNNANPFLLNRVDCNKITWGPEESHIRAVHQMPH